jgi:hypothetical protein
MAGDIVEVNPVFCREIASLALRIAAVGARSVVHTLQFNGKQGVKWVLNLFKPHLLNLCCPRNGK